MRIPTRMHAHIDGIVIKDKDPLQFLVHTDLHFIAGESVSPLKRECGVISRQVGGNKGNAGHPA